jgi:hypothetical protein
MLAVAGAQTLAALLVVAIARYDSSSRLAPHPATAAKLPNLFLRGAKARGIGLAVLLVTRLTDQCYF